MGDTREEAERQQEENVLQAQGEVEGIKVGGEEPDAKRLKTAEEEQQEEAPLAFTSVEQAEGATAQEEPLSPYALTTAGRDVHPDEEEDEAKAGGDAVPITPPEDHRRRSIDRRLTDNAPPPPQPPAPADWRETLFVWQGIVTYNPTKRRCNWVGSWAPQVSHADGPPTSRDFETHQENTFVLHRVLDKRIDLGRATDIPEVLYGRSLSWLGFYKLDQDDGKGRQRLVDFSHLFMVQPVEQTTVSSEDGSINDNEKLLGTAIGVGSNEFGNFISVGRLVEVTTPPEPDGDDNDIETKIHLTMARRYIANNDKRSKWNTPKDAMKELNLETLKSSNNYWTVIPTKVK